ncbi:unnamed protein product [Nezara viridula]|uniref:Uncharacterized protein n=1 Tax=Nezara viridula TaxID=85310 RepID=A0A9P0HKG3_NEZVI|nr:unnamed protein product [Nezara viridula]
MDSNLWLKEGRLVHEEGLFVLLAVAISAVHCQYGGYHQQQAHEYKEGGHDEYAEPHYKFEYSVHDPHTGDIKSQKEERYGDKTQGVYSLVEPDGSQREVQYSVEGKSGFLAQVHKEPGKYKPAPEPSYYKPQPSYHQPQPAYHQPQPAYHQPQPAYHQPQPAYHQPQPSYQQPSYYH